MIEHEPSPIRLHYPDNTPAELRTFERSDAEALFALIEKNRSDLRTWLPWVDLNASVKDSEKFITNSAEQLHGGNGFQIGIWYKGELGGVIGFHPIDWMNLCVMIGYWLGEEFRGKGLVTEAVRLLVNYAFTQYQLHRVEIKCATENHKSIAIPQRLGFTEEGTLREAERFSDHYVDLIVFSMLESEWP
ncbi:MAG: GNAT family N-acetyltransferase [Bacteroidota bacterium]|nr:GNAT family N-acetyltransferase [Bacteroidota bacterium]